MTSVGRIGLALFAVGAFLLVRHFGIFELVGDPGKLQRSLTGTGAAGLVAYVLLYTALQPWGIPGTLFLIAAPLVWPWPLAYVVMMAGTMGASIVGFTFARFVARDWVRARIPERFRNYEARLLSRPLWTVFWLRLVFWMPQPLHAFFGVSSVSAMNHFWGSLLGYAPPLFLCAYFGAAFFNLITSMPLWGWISIALGVAIALVVWWRPRRNTRGGREGEPAPLKRS